MSPSSSVNIAFEQASSSCELKLRPVSRSVHRIGSSDVIAVGSVTSAQVAWPAPSKPVTLAVVMFDWNSVAPVAGL